MLKPSDFRGSSEGHRHPVLANVSEGRGCDRVLDFGVNERGSCPCIEIHNARVPVLCLIEREAIIGEIGIPRLQVLEVPLG